MKLLTKSFLSSSAKSVIEASPKAMSHCVKFNLSRSRCFSKNGISNIAIMSVSDVRIAAMRYGLLNGFLNADSIGSRAL